MKRWKLLAVVAGVAVLVAIVLGAGTAAAQTWGPWNTNGGQGQGPYDGGGMMDGYGGMMGPGMMGPVYSLSGTAEPISIQDATAAVEAYLDRWGDDDLVIGEVMVFTNHAYVQIMEKSTGIGAMELLVDPVAGVVYPEMGPNMMWNLKYSPMGAGGHWGMMGNDGTGGYGMGGYGMGGHMGMGGGMGGWSGGYSAPTEPSADMPVAAEQAIATAQQYLDAYLPGAQVEDEADPFYGYYTLHILRDGETVGMLSVNGYTQQVFIHSWHGEFVEMAE